MATTKIEGEPWLPVTSQWREAARNARKEQGYTQRTLAQVVGGTQAMISEIEKGHAKRSQLVLPMCRVLKIPPPAVGIDDETSDWGRLGAELRHRNEPLFESFRATIRKILEATVPPVTRRH